MCKLRFLLRHNNTRYMNIVKLIDGKHTTILTAIDKYTGRRVTIKRCPKRLWVEQYYFYNTFEAPRLPNFVEIVEERKHFNIVYSHIPGITLYNFMDTFAPLGEKEAVEIVEQIAFCVLQCHQQNILHLNVTPDNLIINKDTYEIHLIDFRSAQQWNDLIAKTLMLSEFAGTPEYAAPEVHSLSAHTNSDSWSIGVIAFSLLFRIPCPFSEHEVYSSPGKTEMTIGHLGDTYFYETSPECKDFFLKVFVQDPTRRLSVKDILNHPWIKS